MFFQEKLEDRLQHAETKMQELVINIEKIDREYEQLLGNLGLNSEQIHQYVENPENFSQPIWERLQTQKKQLDEKLNLSLNQINDPSRLKRTMTQRAAIRPNWIFVR
jgi:hypothetical protein